MGIYETFECINRNIIYKTIFHNKNKNMKKVILTLILAITSIVAFSQNDIDKQKSIYNYYFDKVNQIVEFKNYGEKGSTKFVLKSIEYYTMDTLISRIDGFDTNSKYFKIQSNNDFNNGYAVKLFYVDLKTNTMHVLNSYEILSKNRKYKLYFDVNTNDLIILNK